MLVSVAEGLGRAAEEPREGLMVTSNVRLVRPLGEGGMGAIWVAGAPSLLPHQRRRQVRHGPGAIVR